MSALLSIVYLVRKSEFVLQYLRDEGENEWVVCNLETLVKKEGSIRNKEESQQKDDAGNKKKGEKRRKSRTCAAAFFLSLAPRCFHFCHLTRRMREKKREKLSHVLCDFQSQLVQVILCTTRQDCQKRQTLLSRPSIKRKKRRWSCLFMNAQAMF